MDHTKGGTSDLLHTLMDHLILDMPHAAKHQAFKVSNGSSHFPNIIPSRDLMIYNGFSIYESPHMRYVYSSPNSPSLSTLISLSLVPSSPLHGVHSLLDYHHATMPLLSPL